MVYSDMQLPWTRSGRRPRPYQPGATMGLRVRRNADPVPLRPPSLNKPPALPAALSCLGNDKRLSLRAPVRIGMCLPPLAESCGRMPEVTVGLKDGDASLLGSAACFGRSSVAPLPDRDLHAYDAQASSKKRRVGKACVRPCGPGVA